MDRKVIKIINEARWADGQTVRNRLDDITYNPMHSQEEFVMRMVRENSQTEYGLKYNFKNIHTLEDFRRYIPLTSYDDYADYISRIAHGEKNILTAYLTEYLSSQDGIRVFPQSRWSVQSLYDYSFAMAFNIAGNHSYLTDGMMLNLIDCSMEKLESGMTIGTMLGRLLTKREADNNQSCVVPLDLTAASDETNISYYRALYFLSHKDLSLAICEHYDDMVELLRYIEKHWPKLAEDIENGNTLVESNPERANEIREIMEEHHIGTQIVTQLWPALHCIIVGDVDRLSANFAMLRTYCGPQVHYVYAGICSPEGLYTTTLNLDDPQTVLIPDGMFYEFKPVESRSYSHLLTLDQLEIGRSYELVVTTLSGLYRYKTKKTFLVVGRYHDTPTVIVDNNRL
jgi:hypothetical protein